MISLRDQTASALARGFITWAATPTFSRDGTADVNGGVTDLGDGWWRVWVLADVTTAATSLRIDIAPFYNADVIAGDAVIFAGAQLEIGVLQPSGVYVETP